MQKFPILALGAQYIPMEKNSFTLTLPHLRAQGVGLALGGFGDELLTFALEQSDGLVDFLDLGCHNSILLHSVRVAR